MMYSAMLIGTAMHIRIGIVGIANRKVKPAVKNSTETINTTAIDYRKVSSSTIMM